VPRNGLELRRVGGIGGSDTYVSARMLDKGAKRVADRVHAVRLAPGVIFRPGQVGAAGTDHRARRLVHRVLRMLPFLPGQRSAGLKQRAAPTVDQARRGGIRAVLDDTDGTDGGAHRDTGQQSREPLMPPTEEVSDRARPPSSLLGQRRSDVDDMHDSDVCVVGGHRGAFGTLEQEKSQSEAVRLAHSVICYRERVNHGAEVSVATPAGMQTEPIRGWWITTARHAATKQSWTTWWHAPMWVLGPGPAARRFKSGRWRPLLRRLASFFARLSSGRTDALRAAVVRCIAYAASHRALVGLPDDDGARIVTEADELIREVEDTRMNGLETVDARRADDDVAREVRLCPSGDC
jgi:hypothetical protein